MSFPFPECPDAFGVPTGSLVKVSKGRDQWFSVWLHIESPESLGEIPVARLCPRPATSDLRCGRHRY